MKRVLWQAASLDQKQQQKLQPLSSLVAVFAFHSEVMAYAKPKMQKEFDEMHRFLLQNYGSDGKIII